jgi:nucleoside-diphosphate kinase
VAVEQTLVIVKPDGVQRGLVGEIIGRLERRGLKIVALQLRVIDRDLAERHYAEHQGKPFYPGLVEYIGSGPSVVLVFEGPDAIRATSETVGKTNPAESPAGTIRGDLGLMRGRNLIHRSDGPESARREVALFFGSDEIHAYERDVDRWIVETED